MSAQESRPREFPRSPNHRPTLHLCRSLKIAAIPLLFLLLAAVVRGQSALDGFDPNANGQVIVVVLQPDGKILLGGDFTALSPNGGVAVTRNRIARLNPDGTLDTGFNPNANDTVFSIAVQADGKILAGGQFSTIGGQMRNRIARLDATTGLADSFNPNADNDVRSIAVQADGKILTGGGFVSIGGQSRFAVARLDPTTGLADSFNPNPNSFVASIVVQADGKILVGGGFTSIGGQMRQAIARLDATTGLADSFNANGQGEVRTIALQADGKILAGGDFFNMGGQMRNYIARLDATTGLADSFNPNATAVVNAIAVQADGKILAGGAFTSIGGQTRNRIARLDLTTGLADSFDPNPNSFVYSIAVQADGKILAGGGFGSIGAQTRNNIARLETGGSVDQTLNLNAVGSTVYAAAVQPDGKILLGGNFTSILGVGRNRIARLNSDGTLDATFNPNADSNVLSIVVQQEGKILVGGSFTTIGGQTRNLVARLDSATGLADSFDAQAINSINSVVFAIAVQADGKILLGGFFQNVGGQPRNHICRLDATTGLADSFNPNPTSAIRTMVLQADGKILAGGYFNGANSIGGQNRNYIARLDPTTGLADSFDPNSSNFIQCIAVQVDGKILVGGQFDSVGGQPRNNIARLNAATGTADSFNPNASGEVDSIAVQANGKILVGGIFTSIGGQTRNHIARLDPLMGLSDAFNPGAGNPFVLAITVQTDGKILVGGNFTAVGGHTRNAFARLTNDTAAQQNLSVTPTTISWARDGSSPQFVRVNFEHSSDNVNYTPLGAGTASGSNWTLGGLNLPTGLNYYIRGRGYYRGGYESGSESITQSVRNVFLPGPAGTPVPTPTPTATPTPTSTPTPTASPTNTPPPTPTPSATIPPPLATPTPTPTTTPTPTPPPTASPTPSASPIPTATPGTLGNISTRLRVLAGDNALIGGMIATGTAGKKVIIRAIGPSLSGFGVPGALANPTLDLFQGSALLFSNDDWNVSTQQAEIANSGLAPSDNLEAAIIWTLTPGQNYTAIVRGQNNGTGVGIVEAYDLDQAAASKLGNISTRGFVDVDDNVMIAGLIAGPGNGTSLKILVRALGPTLSDFGVPGALTNPTLDLVNSSGTVIRSNDNWRDDPQQRAAIEAAGLAPSHDEEAALVETVAPGAYTAVVRGSNRATGVALVEAYNIP